MGGSSFWKIVVVIVLLLLVVAGLELVTFRNPQILALAGNMAIESHLPLWLVGLAAPLVFVWKRLFGDSSGAGAKLDALEKDNNQLKQEQVKLRQDVANLNASRDQELTRQLQEISRLQASIDSLNSKISENDDKLVAAVSKPVSNYAAGLDPQQIAGGAAAYLRDNHIEVAE